MPVACFVFALLGLALGASNRKDGKLGELRARHRRDLRLLRDHVHGRGADQGLLDPGVAGDVDAEHPPRRRRHRAARARARARPISRFAFPLPRVAWRAAAARRAATPRRNGRGGGRAGPRAPGRRDPHPALRAAAARRSSTSTSRSSTCRILGHDHRRHARPVLHLDVHRHVGQAVQGPDRRSACCSSSCSGRRRSS